MNRILTAFAFAAVLSSPALSASPQVCYEDVVVPASMSCDGLDSNSADFSSGCTSTGETTKKVEVPCAVGQWVNVSATTYNARIKGTRSNPPTSIPGVSHAEVCASVGLKPADLDGNVCAAGERRPMVGGLWEAIDYKYGIKGDGNKFDGGNRPQYLPVKSGCSNRDRDGGGCSPSESTTFTLSYFCYDSWTKVKNWTKQDAVVAWYCE